MTLKQIVAIASGGDEDNETLAAASGWPSGIRRWRKCCLLTRTPPWT